MGLSDAEYDSLTPAEFEELQYRWLEASAERFARPIARLTALLFNINRGDSRARSEDDFMPRFRPPPPLPPGELARRARIERWLAGGSL